MQQPAIWIRVEFIPLRGVPTTMEEQKSLKYDRPLPEPVPEPPRTIEKGTNWVEEALNAHQKTNILAMTSHREPILPCEGLHTKYTAFT